MPDLSQSLQGRDLGHLRIIAECWGLDFDAPDARVGLPRLTGLLLDRAQLAETVTDLPAPARAALDDLYQHDGRLPWSLFTRRYGQVREVGPARRDRDRPWRSQPSPAELLWYRALVARSFFDTPSGPEEFAYIPDDFLPLIPARIEGHLPPLGRPATPGERGSPLPAADTILDDAATLLAALRLGIPIPSGLSTPPAALQALLHTADLLDPQQIPLPDPTRSFLESPRSEALALLARAWLKSNAFNELRLLPGLRCDGEWRNDPLRARRAVLDFLSTIERDKWWSLTAFHADIRQRHPDFQRSAGEYDAWYIWHEARGEYLRGFEDWDAVEGALLRFLVTGPLFWLGFIDLASPAPGESFSAFRWSAWAEALLGGFSPIGFPAEDAPIKVSSEGRLFVPRLAPRAVRYQLARFGEWDDALGGTYRYRITPGSLSRARQQGLTVNHLLALLRRYAETIPPSLTKALGRWETQGVEAALERVTILRVSTPEVLQTLRGSRAARFLGDVLGPTTIVVRSSSTEKVLAVLAELGYLGEVKPEEA